MGSRWFNVVKHIRTWKTGDPLLFETDWNDMAEVVQDKDLSHAHKGTVDEGKKVDHDDLSNVTEEQHHPKHVKTLADHPLSIIPTMDLDHIPELPQSKITDLITDLASRLKGNYGSYVGDNTVNRPIAHGLGRVPLFIYIWSGFYDFHFIIRGVAYVLTDPNGSASNLLYAVTAPDTTNFYVGNATSYRYSANGSPASYSWIAIG